MFKLTKKIKIFSFSLIIIGLLGIAFGFYSAPSNIEESKEMVASHDHDYEHSSDHDKSSEYYNKYESAEQLAKRVLKVEHQLYPKIIASYLKQLNSLS